MTLILGIIIFLAAAAAFVFWLPRGGKTARFVGTEWEGYVVVLLICAFGLGSMLVVSQLIKGIS